MVLAALPPLDRLDKKLIIHLQEEFPFVLKPFQALAERLSITEKELIERVKHLKAYGIIKRIGPIYNPAQFGCKPTLVGMAVPQEKLKEVVRLINSFQEVTHNYLRIDPQFNLWFTLIAATQKRINAIIKEIKEKSGIKDIVNLPTRRMVKIRTVFKI